MIKPNKDESREDFLHRYMGAPESVKAYPGETERFNAAGALWDNRETLEAANALGYNAERDGAEAFGGRHLQPGVVNYPEMKHPITHKQGIAILIEKDTIDRMRETAKGVPVINWQHDFGGGAEKWITEGKAVGVMVGSHWDGENAWECPEAMVWDKEAKANCRNGFHWSNAWKEDEIDWTPGRHNGVDYDGRLIAAHYTHLAIVPNPRYEGAVIYANALGGIMKLFGIGKDKAVELDKDASLEVAGKKYPLIECVNAIAALEASKAKVETTAKDGVLGDKDELEIDGKKYTGLEVANAIAAAAKIVAAKVPEKKEETAQALDLTSPEFVNAVEARVKEACEKLVGEGFFNGIQKLAQRRPSGTEVAAPTIHKTERERVAAGRKRWGRKDQVAA